MNYSRVEVSIIVPVYNAEKTLERCVNSILSQDFTDFELILVDDGSSDNSGRLCDEFASRDSRVRVFHQNNNGVSSSRNIGLNNAYGKWITFCDSDDYVFPGWLSNFILISEGYDLVVQGFQIPYPDPWLNNEEKLGCSFSGSIRDGLVQLFERHILGYLWVKMFRSDIISQNKIRFNADIYLQEDEEFLLKYAHYCKNMISTERLGYYYYPPYTDKYKDKCNFYLTTKSLFVQVQSFYSQDEYDEMLDYYINYYTDALFEVYQKNETNRKEYLLDYRNTVGKLLLKSRLFVLTRYLMYYDKSGFFSSLFLDLHVKLKRHFS
ncbi:MAG: glycosyltransferase family 2 protein [Candidatus Cryptobacteroides sp.]